jgi:hypothetical protein
MENSEYLKFVVGEGLLYEFPVISFGMAETEFIEF